ncbi:MAG: hypothetical protein J6D29_08020 [Solobacterium sp.]|nr:hypothetical protein [Solobacterium sp.]
MEKEEKSNELRNLKINYFLTSLFVYIGFFIVAYFLFAILLTILQAHPYVYLLVAILLLLADILFTDRLVNHFWKDRWVRS